MSESDQAFIPDHVPADRVRHFDYFDLPGALDSPHAALRRLLDYPALFYSPAQGGHWVAARREIIERVIDDNEHFSNFPALLRNRVDPSAPPLIPIELSPPDHTKYRRHYTSVISRSRSAAMVPFMRELVNDLIDRAAAAGRCEFVEDIAKPLPMAIFLELADRPQDDLPMLNRLVTDFLRGGSVEVILAARDGVEAYFRDMIRQRLADPGRDDDMLGILVRAQIDGRPITEDELVPMAELLMMGALDTTTGELAFMMDFLARNPGHRRLLVDEPGLIPNAVEEMMRCFGLVNPLRNVVRDVAIDGVLLKAGDQIVMPLTLAGYDADSNDDPLTVDFRRENPSHLLFGKGIHTCAGAPLVRVELRVFLEEWLRRIPEFAIPPGERSEFHAGIIMGANRVPLSWPVPVRDRGPATAAGSAPSPA